jgi:uncharacterized protein YndB with AHSA1/START domain
MATIHNEIVINAPMEKIWEALATVDELDRYDPMVSKSTPLTASKTGIGAKRKVEMKDGKNWFEEKVTTLVPNEQLTYELTACSFPMESLSHSCTFERGHQAIRVKQVMVYKVKFGWLGKLMDKLMIKKQSDAGIKKFMAGLKSYAEAKSSAIR